MLEKADEISFADRLRRLGFQARWERERVHSAITWAQTIGLRLWAADLAV